MFIYGSNDIQNQLFSLLLRLKEDMRYFRMVMYLKQIHNNKAIC